MFPMNPTEGQIYQEYMFKLGKWKYRFSYGYSETNHAISALDLKQKFPFLDNGTYWIKNGTDSIEMYCNMSIRGGGWMSFASAPVGNWFGGETGTTWSNTYSYGTYSKIGNIGDYKRSFYDVSEVLFMTGNGTYWISFPLSYIVANGESVYTGIYSSNNFPVNAYNINSSINIYYRTGSPEDPWIQAGNVHSAGYDLGTSYMFWGENAHPGHAVFKNNNGGIIAFVR